jgi:aminoglycoside phosphotransferase (APT) family kinase protein
MLQTYQGYFQNGRFMSVEEAVIPENTRVFVTVVGNELPPVAVSRSRRQLEALERFIAAVREIDNEPLSDEDFAELENNRIDFTREIDL